jgi:NADP-dependent 3-hydroxy acid dehydrogenase YdfG
VASGITAAGGRARAAALDVRDAAAFRALVEAVEKESGRIDYLFNNAGIAVNGEMRDVSLDDFRQVLDVNLNGVVHGVTAVYPHMVARGAGHIVNTASLAGLAPAPGIVSYGASKHAVVGLSLSLRAEAADLGVRVTVICPGFIETPILRESRFVNMDQERLHAMIPIKPISAEACVKEILHGVARNKAIVVVTWQAKALWLLQRISPGLMGRLSRKVARDMRKARRGDE